MAILVNPTLTAIVIAVQPPPQLWAIVIEVQPPPQLWAIVIEVQPPPQLWAIVVERPSGASNNTFPLEIGGGGAIIGSNIIPAAKKNND